MGSIVVVHAFSLADTSHNAHYTYLQNRISSFKIEKKPSLKVDLNYHIIRALVFTS